MELDLKPKGIKRPEPRPQAPIGDSVLSMLLHSDDLLEYRGRKYIKMSKVIQRVLDGNGSRRQVVLWMCIEASGTFPSPTLIVPEFLK